MDEKNKEPPELRLCLNCKGKKYKFNYTNGKYMSIVCDKCDKTGQVAFDSNEDGHGPLRFVQHRVTTEVYKGSKLLLTTSDARSRALRAKDEMVVRLCNGILTVDEMLAVCSMLKKLRSVEGLGINCECCRDKIESEVDIKYNLQ